MDNKIGYLDMHVEMGEVKEGCLYLSMQDLRSLVQITEKLSGYSEVVIYDGGESQKVFFDIKDYVFASSIKPMSFPDILIPDDLRK